MIQPHAVLQVPDGVLNLGVAAVIGLQFQGVPVPVGDEAVKAVGGGEDQLGTRRGLDSPDDEPHRCGVGHTLKGVQAVSATSDAPSIQYGIELQSASSMVSIRFRWPLCWPMVIEKPTPGLRQTESTPWV